MVRNRRTTSLPTVTTVTISTQTARMAQQALNKLNGGDGRSKVIIGQAEMELEKVLGSVCGEQPESVISNGVAKAVPVANGDSA